MLNSWLLSIVGVVLLGVLIELVLSESGTSKFVKSIYACVVLFVVISPLPKLISASGSLQTSAGVAIDSNLLYSINQSRKEQIEDMIVYKLESGGYRNAIITLDVDLFSAEFKINNLYCNLAGLVISPENKNIDRKKAIVGIICSTINIKEELIILND